MACRRIVTDFTDLYALIESAIKWDNLLYQRRKDPNNNNNGNKSSNQNNVNRQPLNNRPLNQAQGQGQYRSQQWANGPRPSNIGSGPVPMQIDFIRGPLRWLRSYRRLDAEKPVPDHLEMLPAI
jgi:hypothetical protein